MEEEKNKPLDPVYAIKFQHDASIATCEGFVEQMDALGTNKDLNADIPGIGKQPHYVFHDSKSDRMSKIRKSDFGISRYHPCMSRPQMRYIHRYLFSPCWDCSTSDTNKPYDQKS